MSVILGMEFSSWNLTLYLAGLASRRHSLSSTETKSEPTRIVIMTSKY